jgi:hypothetical protein
MTPPTPPAGPTEVWVRIDHHVDRWDADVFNNAADAAVSAEFADRYTITPYYAAPPTPPGGLLTDDERAMLEAGLGDNDGVRCGEIMAEIIPAEYGRGIAKAFCRYLLAADARLRTAP